MRQYARKYENVENAFMKLPFSPIWTSLLTCLLSDRYAGAAREHPCCNVHGLQLLEEQLGGVGDVDLGNLGFVLAGAAFEGLLREVAVAC